jgi:hypothetical protein
VDPLGLACTDPTIPPDFAKELEGGGSWLMTDKNYANFAEGRPMIGRPDGQFMTSAKQMNQLIYDTNGDPVTLGQKLGVDSWAADTKLIRMDVADPMSFNPRMPDATMSGANSRFVPGGATSGGVSEVVTDPIPASQVWTTPVVPD